MQMRFQQPSVPNVHVHASKLFLILLGMIENVIRHNLFFPSVAARFMHHLIQSYTFSLFWGNYINSLVQCLVHIFILIIERKIVDEEDRGKGIKRPDRNGMD